MAIKEVIKKADVLIEALPYIQRFRGATIVVKFGGSAMEDKAHIDGVLTDLTFMECAGMLPVVVHGGGKAISRAMKEKGMEPKFVNGIRVTCEQTMEVVQQVMNNEINPDIVAGLRERGARAEGVHGEDIFSVVKKEFADDKGQPVDYGFVGEPHGVDTGPIIQLLAKEIIPVVTPLGRGPDGKVYNTNADTAAAALAKALKARKLAFLSDVPGLLGNPEDQESVISTLKLSEVETLIEKGVISGGMLPKIQSAVEALRSGVRKIHMIDGRMPHSLLLEIFTDKGVGTEIVTDEQD
ncbi:MAG: acetylglutamate kinase [Verrucomicrobia bacterium]|nr:acetylglutamate kinase [Verrucomicrobiota bacterium]